MIQKYFSITIILLGILVVSCRQDNEVNNQNEENSLLNKEALKRDFSKKSDSTSNGNVAQSDSTSTGIEPNDPPKNGTHYRLTDSLGVYIDTNNPPRNGTHYKGK